MKLIELIKDFEMIEIIRDLERFPDKNERKSGIEDYLEINDIPFINHKYNSGTNIFSELGNSPYIGIGSHYDFVPGSPGANDNLSAVAVTIDLLRRFKKDPLKNIGVRGFFFDEEEKGLIGSENYVRQYGIEGLIGVYNMELVGSGDIVALWSVDEKQDGRLLGIIECEGQKNNIPIVRFPNIIANAADHMSFSEKGLEAFTLTTITKKDIEMAPLYYSELQRGLSADKLWEIMEQAPVFSNYHKPSDKSEFLNEKTLTMVSDLLYNSIIKLDSLF